MQCVLTKPRGEFQIRLTRSLSYGINANKRFEDSRHLRSDDRIKFNSEITLPSDGLNMIREFSNFFLIQVSQITLNICSLAKET